MLGIIVFLLIAFLLSANWRRIHLRLVLTGLGLQFALALLVLGVPALGFEGPLRFLFVIGNDLIINLLAFTDEGSRFLFGELTLTQKYGFIFAFQVLPTIIFISSLMAIFYHLGLMQKVVRALALVMQKAMGTSGAESLAAAANVFVGQTEAPLVIRPFLEKLTRSELFCVMVGGMATIAGGVMAAYVGILKSSIPDIAGHLLTASVLSAPAALVMAKIMLPEIDEPETMGSVPKEYDSERPDINVIEAAARGASEGLKLALNVAAMLLAFTALIAMADGSLKYVGGLIQFHEWGHPLVPELVLKNNDPELTFSLIMGWVFAPLAWFMGVPWNEAAIAGTLLGQKIMINEFVAYFNMSQMLSELSDRTIIILSYALCGFANFASIGIQIGGIGSLAPSRRSELALLGVKAIIGGSLAAFMTASIAGILI